MSRMHIMRPKVAASFLVLLGAIAPAVWGEDSAPAERAPIREKFDKSPKMRTRPLVDRAIWGTARAVEWGALDVNRLIAEDRDKEGMGGVPKRIGVNRSAPGGVVTALTNGAWSTLADGTRVWTLELKAEGAFGLRAHFPRLNLPEGAALIVTGSDNDSLSYTYRGIGPLDGQDFWTGTTYGDRMFIEYQDGGINQAVPVIELDEISHMYDSVIKPVAMENPGAMRGLLACQEDVNCHSPDLVARDAVGRMSFTVPGEGSFVCSGSILSDNDPNTFIGWFLTANHCLSTQAAVNTLQVTWFYQTNSCGGGLNVGPTTTGGALISTSTLSDFTLIRLANDPENGQGFAAWTTTTPSGTVIGIHHPGGSWKRYSDGSTTGSAPICGSLPLARYVYNDYFVGVVEGGSSGSPIFNASWQVVGQLFGACGGGATCSNQASINIVNGRFAYTYNNFINGSLNTITPDDAYENNDSFASSADLTAGTHPLRLVDFDDYFRVEVCGDNTITATATFATSTMDLDLELLSSSNVILDSSRLTSGVEEVSVPAPEGEYYIRAIKDNGWGGDYTLVITVAPDEDCNGNLLADECDLSSGGSLDCNTNNIPDDCENPFGDISPLGGSGAVDVDDVVCVVIGFANMFDCPAGDVVPCGGGDGVIDLDDILTIMAAFEGSYLCPTPCL